MKQLCVKAKSNALINTTLNINKENEDETLKALENGEFEKMIKKQITDVLIEELFCDDDNETTSIDVNSEVKWGYKE